MFTYMAITVQYDIKMLSPEEVSPSYLSVSYKLWKSFSDFNIYHYQMFSTIISDYFSCSQFMQPAAVLSQNISLVKEIHGQEVVHYTPSHSVFGA